MSYKLYRLKSHLILLMQISILNNAVEVYCLFLYRLLEIAL